MKALTLAAVICGTLTLQAVDRYVSLDGGHVPPFTSWANAATNIQAAIDVAVAGDTVWVTNGIYNTGGTKMANNLTNRIAMDKAVTVQSVNGPEVTVIEGTWHPGTTNGATAVRCARVGSGAALVGFTLRKGATLLSIDTSGGGVVCIGSGVVSNCVITGNAAAGSGGGIYLGTARDCRISDNRSGAGGGAFGTFLDKCIVIHNQSGSGGGVSGGAATNSAIVGNMATAQGGGSYNAVLNNCTVTGNSAGISGGGAFGNFVRNSIVYFNSAPTGSNYFNNALIHTCSTPLHPGLGNISAPPSLLLDGIHIAYGSACRGAGWSIVASGLDIDGEPWGSPPSMGCDEPVETIPSTYYVDVDATNPVSPYESWTTAATNIQDAVDVAVPGSLIWVTNGVYCFGGRVMDSELTNRLAIYNFLTVKSVNGPEVTRIKGSFQPGGTVGAAAIRCVWLSDGSALEGFTIENGATIYGKGISSSNSGGGVWCSSTNAWIRNCIISNNVAEAYGGGVFSGTISNCVLVSNEATHGGGAAYSALYGCGLEQNQAGNSGGGSYDSSLVSCRFMSNNAHTGGGAYLGSLTGCLITNNTARYAGGLKSAFLEDCQVVNNLASYEGGGMNGGGAINSIISGNRAAYGGGSYRSGLSHCAISNNYAATYGGGCYEGNATNCDITFNWGGRGGGVNGGEHRNCSIVNNAGYYGAGVHGGVYRNCTIVANNASQGGGGSLGAALTNCIVYFNTALESPNYISSTFGYSSSFPLPTGMGNLDADPQLFEASHLTMASPCRGTGGGSDASGTDIDGEEWLTPPSMGCDEIHPFALTGPLVVGLNILDTNVVQGVPLTLTGVIQGRASGLAWNFDDGVIATNASYITSHSWANAGDYSVWLTAYNADNPGGIGSEAVIHVASLESPELNLMSHTNTSFSLEFEGQPGVTYVVEQATNLVPPVVWSPVTTRTGSGGMEQVTDPVATNAMRFYRVRVP